MESSSESARRLPSLWTALRHHPVLFAVAVMLVVGAAGAYTFVTPRVYTSTTVLLLSPLSGNPLSSETATSSANNLTTAMETEAGLVGTPGMVDRVETDLARKLDSAEHVEASAPGGTQVLEISFSSGTADRAQQGAQSFGEQYLHYRQDQADDAIEERLGRLQEQADQADAALRAAAARADSDDRYSQQEVQLYADRLAQLNGSISETRSLSSDPGRILNPALLPPSAAGMSPTLVWVAGAVGGVGLGLVVVLLTEWRRDLVREDDAIDVCGLAVFARVPDGTPVRLDWEREPEPSAGMESYRRLRAALTANTSPPRVLAVTAVGGGSAAPVSANLSLALAAADFTVLLVCADTRGRLLEEILGLPPGPGLSDAVMDGLGVEDLAATVCGVEVLGAGADPTRARELYGGPALQRVVSSCRGHYDYVVLDTAGTGTAEGDAVVSTADEALLVVHRGVTTHHQVRAALDRFAQLNIAAIGVVNAPRPTNLQDQRHSGPQGVRAEGSSERTHEVRS